MLHAQAKKSCYVPALPFVVIDCISSYLELLSIILLYSRLLLSRASLGVFIVIYMSENLCVSKLTWIEIFYPMHLMI